MNPKKLMYTLALALSVGLVVSLVKVEGVQMPISSPISDKGLNELSSINDTKQSIPLPLGNSALSNGSIQFLQINQTIVTSEEQEKNMQAPPKQVGIPVNIQVIASEDNTTSVSAFYESSSIKTATIIPVDKPQNRSKNEVTVPSGILTVKPLLGNGTVTNTTNPNGAVVVQATNTWIIMAFTVPLVISLVEINRMFIL